jgi:hypothetical protein
MSCIDTPAFVMEDLGCLPESARFHLLAAELGIYSTVMKALLLGLLAVAANASPILVNGWGDAAKSTMEDGGLVLFLTGPGIDISYQIHGAYIGSQNIDCLCSVYATGFDAGYISINGIRTQHYSLTLSPPSANGDILGTATVYDLNSDTVLATADVETFLASATTTKYPPTDAETFYTFSTVDPPPPSTASDPTSAPEPATLALVGLALLLVPRCAGKLASRA